MFSSLCSANTKTVLVFMISILIESARSKSENDSTIISPGNDTVDNRRSNLLFEVHLPRGDAKKVIHLSKKQKIFLPVNKTLNLQVPETFLSLKAFEHALIKRVSEYRVKTSLKSANTKSYSKSTKSVAVRAKKIKRQNVATLKRYSTKNPVNMKINEKEKDVKRLKNSKKPDRTLKLVSRNVNEHKLKAKNHDKHTGNKSIERVKKQEPKGKPRNGNSNTAIKNKSKNNLLLRSKITKKTTKSNKLVNLAEVSAKRVRKTLTTSDKTAMQRKFKKIFNKRSHVSKKPSSIHKSQSIIKSKLSIRNKTIANVSTTAAATDSVQASTINKVATNLEESTITGAKETTNVAAPKDITTEEKSTLGEEGKTITDTVAVKSKPVEETTAVTENAPAGDNSTVGERTPVVGITTEQDSTRGQESTPGEQTTPGEETTPAEEIVTEETAIEKTTTEETTTEGTTTTKKVKTQHRPLSRPLVFMGPKEDKQSVG